MSARPAEAASAPSAKFLQARITALSTTLIKRLENIFAQALDDTSLSNANSDPLPPTLTDTAIKQLSLDVESTALIRAAEELMILTRTMKELWLFGGLDTIPGEGDSATDDTKEQERRQAMRDDEAFVVQGLQEYLSKIGSLIEETASS